MTQLDTKHLSDYDDDRVWAEGIKDFQHKKAWKKEIPTKVLSSIEPLFKAGGIPLTV